MNDPTVLQPLGRLVGYANPKVQFEVMRTFCITTTRVLTATCSRSSTAAIRRSCSTWPAWPPNSRNPEVARKLAEILNRKLLKEADENVKSAVIKSLAEMALPEALPELGRFLLSRGLLQTMQGNTLKVEAVKTLARYSDPAAAALAEEVYRKASGDLARAAGQVCLQLKGKLPWT